MTYREPDLTARVAELEAEVAELEAEVERQRKLAGWRDWFEASGPVLVVTGILVAFIAVGYLVRRAERPKSEPIVLADGRHGFVVTCSKGDKNGCAVEAGRACPRGYDVVPQVGDLTVVCEEGK